MRVKSSKRAVKISDRVLTEWAHLPTNVREATATPKDVAIVLKLETIAFANQESLTLDPAETPEGIKMFMEMGGRVLLLQRDVSFLELMPLADLINLPYGSLPESSPLRQIAEKKELLARAEKDYRIFGEPIYVHGIGSTFKQVGDGHTLFAAGLYRQIHTLVNEHQANGKVHFGYIDVGPKKENINLASLALFFKMGAVIDGFEPEVYAAGVPYVRMSLGTRSNINQKEGKIINLSKKRLHSCNDRGCSSKRICRD